MYTLLVYLSGSTSSSSSSKAGSTAVAAAVADSRGKKGKGQAGGKRARETAGTAALAGPLEVCRSAVQDLQGGETVFYGKCAQRREIGSKKCL